MMSSKCFAIFEKNVAIKHALPKYLKKGICGRIEINIPPSNSLPKMSSSERFGVTVLAVMVVMHGEMA